MLKRMDSSQAKGASFSSTTGDDIRLFPSSLLSTWENSHFSDFYDVFVIYFPIPPPVTRCFILRDQTVPTLCTISLHRLSPFLSFALALPRLTFVFYASMRVLTVYFDLDLREISWNSLGAGGSFGKIPFCTQQLLSQRLRSGRNAAGM